MKRFTVWIFAVALGFLSAESGLAGQEVSLPLGTAPPPSALQDLDGNPAQLLDYVEGGKPTIIEFWASWCGNCRLLQPQLDRIQADWGAEVNLVAVAVGVAQTREQVKKHVDDHGIEYTYLWDGEGDAVKAYQVGGTGIVVILDAEGTVAYTGSGGSQDLEGVVRKLLGK